jgi:arylsulfatase A-like enzyme
MIHFHYLFRIGMQIPVIYLSSKNFLAFFFGFIVTGLFSTPINLLYYNQAIKVLGKESLPLGNSFKETHNLYYHPNKLPDSRFININYREGYADISKKVLHLRKNSFIEFQVDFPLNHQIHFQSNSKIKIFLNEKEILNNLLISDEYDNVIKISTDAPVFINPLYLEPLKNKENNKKKTDTLFLVIDSLRADVPGFNGGNFGVTPFLDSLASESFVFKKHYVNSSWTRPSTLIFFTGMYPSKTFINIWDYPVFKSEKKSFYQSSIQPLPSYLSKRGYKTILIGNNPFFSDHRSIGIDVGFEEVVDFSFLEKDTIHITNYFIKYWESHKNDLRPVFIFLNYNDPHKPYEPPYEFINVPKISIGTDPRKKAYLGEVAFVDSEIRKVFLKIGARLENMMVIVTSDHGEVMNPYHAKSIFNGVYTLFGHGQGLYEEDIHVPLILKLPGQKFFKEINQISRSIDLYPTILDILKFDPQSNIDGLSLKPIIKGEELENRIYYGESRGVKGVRVGNYKLQKKTFEFHKIGNAWDGKVGQEYYFLFDLLNDPEEKVFLKNEQKEKELKSFFLNENSNLNRYNLRIFNIKETPKKIKIIIKSYPGKIIFETLKSSLKSPSKINLISDGAIIECEIDQNEIEDFKFKVYPDVNLPNVHILIDGKPITKGQYGVGEKDIYPSECTLIREDCNLLYHARNSTPRKPKNFRVQFWMEPSSSNLFEKNIIMEKDTIDILKKQGYIQ